MHIVLISVQLIQRYNMTEPDPILEEAEEDLIPVAEIEIQPRDINLGELTDLAVQLENLDQQILEAEANVSVLKQARKTVAEEQLPTLMEQAGVTTLKLVNGKKIEVKEFVDARIKDPNVAFDWLRQTNNDSIIKNSITVDLGKNEDSLAQEVIATLKEKHDIEANVRVGVHNMTLKSFCRDALDNPELAESLPRDAFGIYEGKRAKIT